MLVGRRRLLLANLIDQLRRSLAVERRSQSEQLIQGRTQTVHIGPSVDRAVRACSGLM